MNGGKLYQNESLRSRALRAHARKSLPARSEGRRREGSILARFWGRLRALAQ